jgi:hypothetical protein
MPLDTSATLLSFNRVALSCPVVCEVTKYLLKRKRSGKTPRLFYTALQMIKPKFQTSVRCKACGDSSSVASGAYQSGVRPTRCVGPPEDVSIENPRSDGFTTTRLFGSSDLHISMLSNFNVSMRYQTSMKGGKSVGGIANHSPFEAVGKFI